MHSLGSTMAVGTSVYTNAAVYTLWFLHSGKVASDLCISQMDVCVLYEL